MLTACNKGKDKNPAVTYGDIYVQHGGIVRKVDYDHDRSFVLPEGLMPYYEEKGTVNTYKEYVNAYDKENGVLRSGKTSSARTARSLRPGTVSSALKRKPLSEAARCILRTFLSKTDLSARTMPTRINMNFSETTARG